MLDESKNFIDKCKRNIKFNNKNIKELSRKANEYEAIIGVIAKTDISGNIIRAYQEKINNCLNKIDRFLEDNKNNHDLINTMKQVNKIIDSKR